MPDFVIGENVIAHAMGDEVAILNLDTGRYFSLNGTGARIWTMIEGGLSHDAIAQQMSQEFDCTMDQIAADADALIANLARNGLLQVSAPE